MKLELFNDLILVTSPEKKIETSGGIKLSGSAMDELDSGVGIVELIGNKVKKVEVGNTIFYHEYDAKEIFVDGKKKWLIKEENILGRFIS